MRFLVIGLLFLLSNSNSIGQTSLDQYSNCYDLYESYGTTSSQELFKASSLLPTDSLNFCLLSFLVKKKQARYDSTLLDSIYNIVSFKYNDADYDNALIYADLGMQLAINGRDTSRFLDLAIVKIRSHFRKGDYYTTQTTILNCKTIALQSRNYQAYSSLLLREGYLQWKIFNFDKALLIAEEYKNFIKKYDLPLTEMHSYHGLIATTKRWHGNFEESRTHGDSAIYYAYLFDDEKAKGLALSNRAIQYSGVSEDFEYRVNLLKRALAINKKMQDKQQLGSNFGALSFLLMRNNEIAQAVEYSQKSLEIAEEINNINEIYLANRRLSILFNKQQSYSKALEHKKKEFQYYEQLYGAENLYKLFSKTIELKNLEKQEQLQEIAYQKEANAIEAKKQQNQVLLALIGSLLFLSLISFLAIRKQAESNVKDAILKREFQNQIYQLEHKTLSSQMNPHFLFNSLNSIKSYIAKNEPRQATSYLNKFSQLIRHILDISKEEQIPLSLELKTLKLYVDLEQLRMSNAFKYIVNIGHEVDLDHILLPPLTLQPFVENSIWHGLSHKKEDKELKVDVIQEGSSCKILISDNGIGRLASEKIKQKNKSQHTSHGMRITKDRLKLREKNLKSTFKITVTDLYDPANNPVGTSVQIEIPMN